MTGTSQPDQRSAYFSSTALTPGFWRPIEFSIPAGVSVTRGGGLPTRGRRVVPLEQIAPSRFTSTTSPYSTPYPKVPEATSSGLRRTRPRPRSTERSISGGAAIDIPIPPPAQRRDEHPADDADQDQPLEHHHRPVTSG